jgi:hypothetical protein
VASEAAAGDEARERELFEQAGAEVIVVLLAGERIDQPRWREQPAKPERRRERLARRADRDHLLGDEALQGPERAAVVAQLSVVVVLDDQRAAPSGPGGERLPPLAAEGGTARVGVRGCDEERVDARVVERLRVESELVDGDRDRLQSACADRISVPGVARLLDGDAVRAGAAEDATDERQPLHEPAADDDPVGGGDGAARAAEVVGQRLAQRLGTEDVGIAERRIGELGHRGAIVAQPVGARKERRVGEPAEQANRRLRGARPSPAVELLFVVAAPHFVVRAPACLPVGPHPRPAAPPRLEVPVRGQVSVRLDDHRPGDAEVGGEHPRGRKVRAGTQPLLLDRVPQPQLEPLADAPSAPGRQLDQQIGRKADPGIGLRRSHSIGR